MAFPSPQRLAELLRHLQRQTMRCQQELNIIKSPDVEYEERMMFVKFCIDECWERYDHRSRSGPSQMREEIINHGRELERLSFRREVGLAEATATYNRRLDEVWTTYAIEFITVLQPSLPEQTILRLCESSGRICASRDARRCAEAQAAPAMSAHAGASRP